MTPESDVPAAPARARRDAPPARIRVWDLPTRLFHWTLVALIATSWVSAIRGWMTVHYVCGVTALVLVSFRIVWGFLGSTTARFADFAASPGRVFAYLRALRHGDDSRHAGHNPAGGWMVMTFPAADTDAGRARSVCQQRVRLQGPVGGAHQRQALEPRHPRARLPVRRHPRLHLGARLRDFVLCAGQA